jgi:hypothetical protein
MHQVVDQKELDEVVELAEKYLKPYQPKENGYEIRVVPEGVQREDDWYELG